MIPAPPLRVFAPAKINLYLHVTGRRDDGYHTLDSMVVFADIGDRITIEAADGFSFRIDGPFAGHFQPPDRDGSARSTNLVVRAAHTLARVQEKKLDYRITLTKNLPLAAGLGGGSADAAAVLWGLMTLWGINRENSAWLSELSLTLGADVLVCLRCAPARMTGVGEDLTALPLLPEIPVVLVNPLKPCDTAEIFRRFAGPMRGECRFPETMGRTEDVVRFIRGNDNDLTPAATEIVPEIALAQDALMRQDRCLIARMSGSGASVFGLFSAEEAAREAAARISVRYPGWWVKAGTVNAPARY